MHIVCQHQIECRQAWSVSDTTCIAAVQAIPLHCVRADLATATLPHSVTPLWPGAALNMPAPPPLLCTRPPLQRKNVLSELASDCPDMQLLYTTPESLLKPALRDALKVLRPVARRLGRCEDWGLCIKP